MNKTFKRILAAFLVLCMIPAAVITAFAHGPGVAGNTTQNQSYDNAKDQYIPETIVVDGKFDDTGWPIEGWNYVTSSTGNWDVEYPEGESQQLMYQYQLRADYKYFYVGAVVVLPQGISTGDFYVYLSDNKASGYELTTAAFQFSLANDKVTVKAIDCRTDDAIDVSISSDHKLDGKLVDNNKYYIEFRNNVADTYNSANEIRYFVSASITTNGNKNELFHPIYYTNNGVHSVPTSEFWPGGGNVLSCMGEKSDTFEGAVSVDGDFDEAIWQDVNETTGFKAATLFGKSNFTSNTSRWRIIKPETSIDGGLGQWQNQNSIEGFYYIYKVASDGTNLYVAVEINCELVKGTNGNGTNVRFWIRNNSNLGIYTHFYDINAAECASKYNTSTTTNTSANISNSKLNAKMVEKDGKTYAEFSIPLSEFGGTNGFDYYIAVANKPADKNCTLYFGKYRGAGSTDYSDTNSPWKKWNNGADVTIDPSTIHTNGTFVIDGDFSDDGWVSNYDACDVLQNITSDVKYDADYMYGKVTAQFKSGKSMSDLDKIRLWVAPNVSGSDPYAVDLTSSNCEIVKIQKKTSDLNANNSSDNGRTIRYDVEEVACGNGESKYTVSGNNVVFEFKVPLGAVGCKVGLNGNGSGNFGYYISAEKGDTKTLYSNKLGNATTVNIDSDTYKNRATSVTEAVENSVNIDGNLDEELWGDDFYNATFGNSVVMQQPKWGGSYEYSYMLYAGSNYLYGAVELDGVANDNTVFTLWLDNGIDEYKWIGDNDPTTPHISYKVYPHTEESNKYTGDITIGSGNSYSAVSSGKENITVNRLMYYTNYKYEFNLGKGESSAVPDFYYPTDSNLENDKVAITKGKNYDYKVQTINGKTYLEFMIDVKNFHWDVNKSDSIEYVTSMTHEVNVNGAETITVYNPAINDRSNFWLTNINSENGSRHDGVGYLYDNITDFTLPVSRWWSGVKFKPVSGSSTQYEIEEIVYGGESKYDGKELDEIFVYTEADAKAGKLYYYAFTGTLYNEYGKTYIRHLEIHYPATRYIDVVSIQKNNQMYYINRNVLDGRNGRAQQAREMLFSWNVGDVVEFGYSGGTSSTTNALTGSELVAHKDLATKTDIEQTMPGWELYTHPKELPVLDKDEVTILSYEYEDLTEVGGGQNNTGYCADTSYNADTGKGLLNNDTSSNSNKNTMDMKKTVVLYLERGSKDAQDRSSIIADLGSVKTTNAYTAYLTDGTASLDALSTSLEVYGSNDKSNWERITGASYRQLLLQKGDGLTLSKEDTAIANKPTVSFASSNGAQVVSGPPLSMLVNDNISNYDGDYDPGTNVWWWNQTGSQALLIKNTKYSTNNNTTFDIIFEYPIERSINQIDITYFTLVNRVIGVPKAAVKVYTTGTNDPSDAEAWKYVGTINQTGLPVFDEASDIYDSTNSVLSQHHNVKLVNAKGNLDNTYTSRYFKLTFEFDDYPGGKTYKKENGVVTGWDATYEWDHVGFTEIDLTHTLAEGTQGSRVPYDVDNYSLTAVAEEPVNYRYLKYTLIETSPSAANCVGLDEIEAHYSTALDDLPKQTILHLNTDQKSNKIAINPKNDTYLGRYNTIGSVWQNNGSSMSQPNTNGAYTNQVFAETLLVPGFNYNGNADVSFYSNFYIERVKSNPISQPDKPVDSPNTSLDWDGRNANVLKKLEHIAPDRVVVDGNLNDTGWDGTWTEVDGSKNATNLEGTGATFKYQLRADGEYLYAAAIIDSAYNATNEPTFGIWLKGNDGIAYYSVGYGSTTIDFAKPQPTAEYGAVDTLSIATKNGAIFDEANEKMTFGYNLVAKKNGTAISDSYIFGYTDEIKESTSDGIWVWEGRPQTQGFTFANESAMMSASGSTLVTGLNDIGESKTLVEFRVKLDEFGGKDGFEYFVEATTASGTTIYPYVRAENGYVDANHPENNWDSDEAIKVTVEDMTGWGDYRMVEDYAPVTSLGAKVNPSYNGKKTVRFGARYTEEFIRRQSDVAGTDYWDVADAGIVILPTHLLGGSELTLDSENIAYASAQDIVNWQNVPDEGTNFADYESFVFYVNLVGVEGIEDVPLTFRSYVDYYNANGSETYYSIPLERSYNGVYNTANENAVLPK